MGELLHRDGWRKAFTVAEMVDKWERLVGEVEQGYSHTIHEYTNDLYSRNWLWEASGLLHDFVVQDWTPRLMALDNRFTAATIADDGAALSHFHKLREPDWWWWRRYPRNLTGPLGKSLRDAGATGSAPEAN
ncbi:hypothetical protein [Glycomyces artemisiae]|uniref:Uncharacterized protein n=1 Tax=Glycomyces artemisiae TaxID=1076443 RepID=A0A2T0UVS4_9ACTN|nr:hypothetical protein [Glycomyces artemisiae]PRY62032.1 hypothetical protein B0I28_101359 [Glycomyces artemisiae]